MSTRTKADIQALLTSKYDRVVLDHFPAYDWKTFEHLGGDEDDNESEVALLIRGEAGEEIVSFTYQDLMNAEVTEDDPCVFLIHKDDQYWHLGFAYYSYADLRDPKNWKA